MSLLASISSHLKFWDFKDDVLLLKSKCEFYEPGGPISGTNDLLALAWNHNQQVVAVGGTSQKLHLVQASTGQTLSSLPIDERDSFVGDVRALSFSHNSRYLASGIDKDVVIWDLKKRSIKTRLNGHKAVIKCLQFNNEGAVLSGDASGAMIIWNIDQSSRSKELINPGYRSPMHCLKLSPNNQRLCCCGYGDGSVTIWDIQSLTSINRCVQAHEAAVTSIAYSPKNDRLIATGGKDGKLNLVDLGNKQDKYSPAVSLNIGEPISTISFHDSALYTAVGTERGYIHVYDWRDSRKPVVQFAAHNPMPVYELAFQQTPPPRGSSKKDSGGKISTVTSVTSASSLSRTLSSLETSQQSSSTEPPAPPTSISTTSASNQALSSPKENRQAVGQSKELTSSPSAKQESEPPSVIENSANSWKEQSYSTTSALHKPAPTETPPRPPKNTLNNQTPAHLLTPSRISVSRNEDAASLSSRVEGSIKSNPVPSVKSEGLHLDNDRSIESHIRDQLQPVTYQQLTEALQLIQYDVHREVQAVIREQVRQFSIAKEDTAALISQLSGQLQHVLKANKELRAENERLRRIY